MKIRRSLISFCAGLAVVTAGLVWAPATRAVEVGALKIDYAWVRESPIGGTSGGGYMRIINTGKEADRLLSAESAAATSIVLQEMSYVDEKLNTRSLANGIEIPAGKTIQLQWSSSHLLFKGLKEPFARYTDIEASLNFEKAGRVPVTFRVRPRVEH